MKNYKKYIIFCIIFLVIIVGVARWRVVSIGDKYIFDVTEISKIDDCQNILLLGAKVKFDGNMSPILKERAMAVVDLYKKDKVCKIVISGYKEVGDDYIYDEVTPVKKYFIKQGIPKNIITSDYNGIDTFTSLRNLQEIFSISNVVIVTQEFHLPRALYIARTLGMRADGYVAYKFPYPTSVGMYKDLIREWPASLKAVWQVDIRNLFFSY